MRRAPTRSFIHEVGDFLEFRNWRCIRAAHSFEPSVHARHPVRCHRRSYALKRGPGDNLVALSVKVCEDGWLNVYDSHVSRALEDADEDACLAEKPRA
jgi:hypothetical protein